MDRFPSFAPGAVENNRKEPEPIDSRRYNSNPSTTPYNPIFPRRFFQVSVKYYQFLTILPKVPFSGTDSSQTLTAAWLGQPGFQAINFRV